MAGKTDKALKAMQAQKAAKAAAEKKKAEKQNEVIPVAVASVLGILYFIMICLSSASTLKNCALVCVIIMLIPGAVRFKVLRDRVWILLFLYVLMDGISTFYAVSGKFGLYEFLKVLIGFTTAVSLLAISPVKERMTGRFLAYILAVCAAFGSLVSIDLISTRVISSVFTAFLGLFTEDYVELLPIEVGVRMNSIFANPNIFAGFCGIGVLLSLGLADTAKPGSSERIFADVLLFITAFAFVLAFSMGASLFIVLGFLIFRAPLKTPARRHSGSFAAYLRCENLEIHKVFLRFSPSICGKISRCASRPGFLEVPFIVLEHKEGRACWS